MRRAKEEERFAARQAQRQKLIDEQVANLADLNASTNNRLEAQVRARTHRLVHVTCGMWHAHAHALVHLRCMHSAPPYTRLIKAHA